MAKSPLTKESQFTVGEEKALNNVMAVFFIALFLYGLVDAISRNFKNIDYQSYVFAFAIVPAVYCLRRAYNKKVYIRVNNKGIYQNEKLVTDWANFTRAFLTQDEKLVTIKDNFLLIVEFRKEGQKEGVRRKIPLTNTQNKSEEEVLDAVRFFWNEYKNNTGVRL